MLLLWLVHAASVQLHDASSCIEITAPQCYSNTQSLHVSSLLCFTIQLSYFYPPFACTFFPICESSCYDFLVVSSRYFFLYWNHCPLCYSSTRLRSAHKSAERLIVYWYPAQASTAPKPAKPRSDIDPPTPYSFRITTDSFPLWMASLPLCGY